MGDTGTASEREGACRFTDKAPPAPFDIYRYEMWPESHLDNHGARLEVRRVATHIGYI
jgi:hypothetical protein